MNTLRSNNFKFNDYLNSLRGNNINEYQEELKQKKIDKQEEIINSSTQIKTPYIMKKYMHERKEHQKDFDKINKKWMVVDDPETAYTSKNKFKNEFQNNLSSNNNCKKPWNKLNIAIKNNRIKNYCSQLTDDIECNKEISLFVNTKFFEREFPPKWISYDDENGVIENIENLYIIENNNGVLVINEELEEHREFIENECNKRVNNGKYIPVFIKPLKKVRKVKKNNEEN
jgi:hypothetical protein